MRPVRQAGGFLTQQELLRFPHKLIRDIAFVVFCPPLLLSSDQVRSLGLVSSTPSNLPSRSCRLASTKPPFAVPETSGGPTRVGPQLFLSSPPLLPLPHLPLLPPLPPSPPSPPSSPLSPLSSLFPPLPPLLPLPPSPPSFPLSPLWFRLLPVGDPHVFANSSSSLSPLFPPSPAPTPYHSPLPVTSGGPTRLRQKFVPPNAHHPPLLHLVRSPSSVH
ncbi:unnamed protein product [Closterium sp. Naga37s-1]|nr:unnamed protein product [Closterium sp. Naga37s-1]